MNILKNTLEGITRYWIRRCLHKSIGGPLPSPNIFYGLEAYDTQEEVARLKISDFLQ